MSLLDGISFVEDFKFEAYGVSFSVKVTDLRAIDEIKQYLPFYTTILEPSAETDRKFALIWNIDGTDEDAFYDENGEVARRVDVLRLAGLLGTWVRLGIGEYAPRHIFIHAGVVGWQGKALIFPGTSYSGKTTLTAELVKQGATYYSDEYAVIDDTGLAHPYPKPLSLRKEGEYEQTDTDVSALGGRQGIEPLPVGMVFLTTFDANAEWNPEVLSAGQGVMEILPHALALRSKPEFVLKVLNLISKRAIISTSKRGEVSHFAKLILNFPDNHFFT